MQLERFVACARGRQHSCECLVVSLEGERTAIQIHLLPLTRPDAGQRLTFTHRIPLFRSGQGPGSKGDGLLHAILHL